VDLSLSTQLKDGYSKRIYSSCEKGFKEATSRGILAGYPVVDVEVELIDGNYHDVDSSELAFKIAAIQAFKDGGKRADPSDFGTNYERGNCNTGRLFGRRDGKCFF